MAHTKQDGVSLMLAVLVLSAITAIAFSMATIVFIEIRTSGESARTEPALYAVLGVTEEALMQYKHNISPATSGISFNVPTCAPVSANVCSINGVTITLPGTQPLQYDDTPIVQSIAGGEILYTPMYLVNDFTQQYGRIRIKLLSTGSNASLKVNFRKTSSNGTTNEAVLGTSVQITENSGVYEFSGFEPNAQFDLILDNSANPTQPLSVSIETFGTDNSAKGLPFIGQQVLRMVADYQGLTRTYQVKIPIP